MSYDSPIGALFDGFASGARARSIMDRRDQQRSSAVTGSVEGGPETRASNGGVIPAGGPETRSSNGGVIPAGGPETRGSNGGVIPMRSADPVAGDLAPHQRAFLNAISDGESAGKYNVRYTPNGGAEFSDLSQHPGIMEPGPHGPSSAAGRYQFTKSTWNRLGGGEFSPENQDRMAWKLATLDYRDRTGRDLDKDLQQNGLTPNVLNTLQPTWTSFGSKQESRINAYNSSLRRYSGGPENNVPKSVIPRGEQKTASGAIGIMRQLFPAPKSVMDMGYGNG